MSASPDKALIVSLFIEIRILEELKEWQPVGSLLDLLSACLLDEEGLTKREIGRLRLWAKRWSAVHQDVRRFYQLLVENISEDEMLNKSVDTALWLMLHGDGARVRPTPGLYSRLRERWVSIFGHEPTFELIPNLNNIVVEGNDAPRMPTQVGD